MGLLLRVVYYNFRRFSTKAKPGVMKYLNVAEKNDAAKNIASLLSRGASTRREGLSTYNKIYEFNAQVFGTPVGMVMTSVSGHLLDYVFVPAFKNWKSCNPAALFDAPIVKECPKDYQNIKRTLEREVRSCDGLIIWTDCDREGENIGFEIIKVCTDVKPNIPVYRAKFSEITAASVFRALNNLGQANKNISNAVDVRQELDLRTGAAFTRLQTLRLQRVFPHRLADKLISYGSCQFPALGFVVERYQAIEKFVPEPFWKIKMNHTVGELTVDHIWNRERLFNKNACEAILDICEENPVAKVENVESKSKSKWRPLPLDTVEFEKTVSRKLRINAKDAMKIAEKLYTQGLISYPRTETNMFPKELDLQVLVEHQRANHHWGEFAQRILNEGGPNPRRGQKSDQAHPPIHPIKYANNLQGNEQRIYEFIVRHFLACVSKDALGYETTVHVSIADEKFTAKGLLILEKNYLEVYIYDKWNAKEIHEYRVGDTFTPSVLELVSFRVICLLYLTHIDKIKSREYVGIHENIYFIPGTLGMGLVEGYNNIGLEISLAKPNLRAEFENDLKLICEGQKNPEIVRREQIAKYKIAFQTVAERVIEIDRSLGNRLNDEPQIVEETPVAPPQEVKPIMKCPKCDHDMILRDRKTGNGKYISCIAFPACKNAVWLSSCIDKIEALDETCRTCGPNVRKLKIKFKQNPFPGEPNPNILCIGGCDRTVLENLNIRASSVSNQLATNASVSSNRNPISVIPNMQTLDSWLTNTENNSTTNRSTVQRSATQNTTTTQTGTTQNRPLTGNRTQTKIKDEYSGTQTSNSNRISRSFLSSPTSNTPPPPPSLSILGTNVKVICNCEVEAILLTVKKECPNKGKRFYKCMADQCRFFMWEPGSEFTKTATINPTIPTIKCSCDLPVIQRVVAKAGPNNGRKFYSCSKPAGQDCNFFKWAEENNQPGTHVYRADDDGRSSQSWNTASTSTTVAANSVWKRKGKNKSNNTKRSKLMPPSRPRVPRRCGVCGQEGHTRQSCPNGN